MGKVIYLNKFLKNNKTRGSKMSIDKKARTILEKFDLLELPVDPLKLANIENIDVYNANFKKIGKEDYVLGAIKKDENKKISIYVNEKDTYNRRRFTIAHELGHFYLGHLNESTNQIVELERNAGYNTSNNIEVEANQFAAALLMEKNAVTENFRILKNANCTIDYTTSTLSDLFGVSQQAMKYRLKNLGLI